MQLYEVHFYEGGKPEWRRTLGEAHRDAKLSANRPEVRIRLMDYPSDQQVFCDLFNGQRPDGTLKRLWRLTPRGGLFELPLDGSEPAVPEPAAPPPSPQNIAESAELFWARMTAPKEK